MEKSQSKQMVVELRDQRRKNHINDTLRKKRLQNLQNISFSRLTATQEESVLKSLENCLENLVSANLIQIDNKEALKLISDFKDIILELVSGFEEEQIDSVLRQMFEGYGKVLIDRFSVLLEKCDEDLIHLTAWTIGLICISNQPEVLSSFRQDKFLGIFLKSLSFFSRLKIKTISCVLYAVKHIVYRDSRKAGSADLLCQKYFKFLLPFIDQNLKEIELRSDILELLAELAISVGESLVDYATQDWIEFLDACVEPELDDTTVQNALDCLSSLMNIMSQNMDEIGQKMHNYIENLYANGFYDKISKLLTEKDHQLVYNATQALESSLVFTEEIELNMVSLC